MRRFYLHRIIDKSGVSGTGNVAGGVCFDDGRIALRWNTETRSVELWDSASDMMAVHGHGGATALVWIDS